MLVKVNQRKLICYDDKSLKLIYLPTRAVFPHKAQIMWNRESWASGSLPHMLVFHQLKARGLSSMCTNPQNRAAGLSARPAEACITERATVSYEHETSSSDNSWLWPQDGSNIKDGGKREELYDSAVREEGGTSSLFRFDKACTVFIICSCSACSLFSPPCGRYIPQLPSIFSDGIFM